MSLNSRIETSVWYLNISNIGGKNILANISFPITIALIFIQDFILSNSYLNAALTILAALAPWLIMEAANLFLLNYFSIKFDKITVYPCCCTYKIRSKIKNLWIKMLIWLLPCAINIILPVLILSYFQITPENFQQSPLITNFCTYSLALAVLNLLPVHPLKLYQLSSQIINNRKQKIRLSKVSFFIAILIFILSFNSQSLLGSLFALILLSLSSKENSEQKTAQALEQLTIREVMIPVSRLVVLPQTCKLSDALSIAMTSMQTVFPIVSNQKFLSAISRDTLIKAAATESDGYLGGLSKDDCLKASVNTALPKLYRKLQDSGKSYAAIHENENFTGMVVLENLNENLMIRSIQKHQQDSKEDEFNL